MASRSGLLMRIPVVPVMASVGGTPRDHAAVDIKGSV